MILGQQRSGTTLLATLLDSHPYIHCEDELFYYRKFLPFTYLSCRNKMSPKDVFGFKLMPNHIGYQGYSDINLFISRLIQYDYKFIKLTRRDLLRVTVSLIFAQKIGQFHYKKNDINHTDRVIFINPVEFRERLAWFYKTRELLESITSKIPHLELVYEDHLQDPQKHQTTIDDITSYLGLPKSKVHSDLIKVAKDDYSSLIENYSQLVQIFNSYQDD